MPDDRPSTSEEILRDIAKREYSPFATVEAALENTDAIWGLLAKQGVQVWTFDERGNLARPAGRPGEIAYHLHGVENYLREIQTALVAVVPELYADSEYGIRSTSNLPPDAFERLKALYTALGWEWKESQGASSGS